MDTPPRFHPLEFWKRTEKLDEPLPHENTAKPKSPNVATLKTYKRTIKKFFLLSLSLWCAWIGAQGLSDQSFQKGVRSSLPQLESFSKKVLGLEWMAMDINHKEYSRVVIDAEAKLDQKALCLIETHHGVLLFPAQSPMNDSWDAKVFFRVQGKKFTLFGQTLQWKQITNLNELLLTLHAFQPVALSQKPQKAKPNLDVKQLFY